MNLLSNSMKTSNKLLLLTFSVLFSCQSTPRQDIVSRSKSEIIETEKAFATMVKKEGIAAAFAYYAAEDAIINYNDSLLKGRDEIKKHYANKKFENVSLEWIPDFVDVSASGDLGYTYGNYTFTKRDSTGKIEIFKGIFHTVWKKQTDGMWHFVWD
jgi:ketosteroid isomerase-like protein